MEIVICGMELGGLGANENQTVQINFILAIQALAIHSSNQQDSPTRAV